MEAKVDDSNPRNQSYVDTAVKLWQASPSGVRPDLPPEFITGCQNFDATSMTVSRK